MNFNATVDRNLERAQAIFDAQLPEDAEDIAEREAWQRWRGQRKIDNYEDNRG